MVKLHVFNLGNLKLDANLLVQERSVSTLDCPSAENYMMEFPVPAFLLETDRGLILFDTGCHPDAMKSEEEGGRWPHAFQRRVPWDGDETKTVMYNLEKLGIKNDDIDTIVLSHMHNGHAGCVEFFPKARFVVSQDEFSCSLRAYAQHRYMSSYIWKDTDVWTKMKLNWDPIEREDGDICLAPGVTALNLGPGHAAGMIALKVDLVNYGPVIIASDCIYNKLNYEKLIGPGICFDSIGWMRTAKRIRRIASETGAEVWFGHDAEQFAGIRSGIGEYYD